MTNSECIEKVQGNLVKMAELVNTEQKDNIDVAGVPIEVSPQDKNAIKQAVIALRVDCITTLNQIQM